MSTSTDRTLSVLPALIVVTDTRDLSDDGMQTWRVLDETLGVTLEEQEVDAGTFAVTEEETSSLAELDAALAISGWTRIGDWSVTSLLAVATVTR